MFDDNQSEVTAMKKSKYDEAQLKDLILQMVETESGGAAGL